MNISRRKKKKIKQKKRLYFCKSEENKSLKLPVQACIKLTELS